MTYLAGTAGYIESFSISRFQECCHCMGYCGSTQNPWYFYWVCHVFSYLHQTCSL